MKLFLVCIFLIGICVVMPQQIFADTMKSIVDYFPPSDSSIGNNNRWSGSISEGDFFYDSGVIQEQERSYKSDYLEVEPITSIDIGQFPNHESAYSALNQYMTKIVNRGFTMSAFNSPNKFVVCFEAISPSEMSYIDNIGCVYGNFTVLVYTAGTQYQAPYYASAFLNATLDRMSSGGSSPNPTSSSVTGSSATQQNSMFSNSIKYADSNTYKNINYSFSIQPPINWVVLNNLPSSVSNQAIVIFSNNDKSQLATFGVYHRTISRNVINAINTHSDNDVLTTLVQEMSHQDTESTTTVLNEKIDRYNDGTRAIIISTTTYANDNSILESENVIYFLNSGEQYTLELTTDPVHFGTNSQLFEESINSFLVSQASSTRQPIQIPSWVKNNAHYWSIGNIGDDDFVKGIQYLIQQKIITIPPTTQGSSSQTTIPSWIKKDAGWWSVGELSDDDFIKAIQYLITNGIISP